MRSELIGFAAIAGCVSYPWLADGWHRFRTRTRREQLAPFSKYKGIDR